MKRQAADAWINRKCTEAAWSIPLARFHISANQVQTDLTVPQTMATGFSYGQIHIRGVAHVFLSFRFGANQATWASLHNYKYLCLTKSGGRTQWFHSNLDAGVFAAQVQYKIRAPTTIYQLFTHGYFSFNKLNPDYYKSQENFIVNLKSIPSPHL